MGSEMCIRDSSSLLLSGFDSDFDLLHPLVPVVPVVSGAAGNDTLVLLYPFRTLPLLLHDVHW